MPKRTAENELNHDNWDQEDEPEEAGDFTPADKEVLEQRVIKVAKRRCSSNVSATNSPSNIFSGFSFANSNASSPTSNFSFLSSAVPNKTVESIKTSTPPAPMFNFQANTANTVPKPGPPSTSTFNFISKSTTPETNATRCNINGNSGSKEPPAEDTVYLSKLKGLNESVLAWITKHVKGNPLISLQPIFKDYDKYFAELEKMRPKKDPPAKVLNETSPQKNATMGKELFKNESPISAGSTVTFNHSDTTKSSQISQGSFSFCVPSPFGSNSVVLPKIGDNTTATTTTVNEEQENDADDEPPKVEFAPVVEEGHVFSTRCKVFFKEDNSYRDRGVGNLFLKPISNNDKYQLIIRADTCLGNILCNFILSDTIPTKRMGGKDVMLIYQQTINNKQVPTTILIRVKNSEDADNLLTTLDNYKR